MASHEQFLELCAVSISGELTKEERIKLDEHLKGCASCREVLEQFKASVKEVIPAAAEDSVEQEVDSSFSLEKAEAAFFSRFDREGGFDGVEPGKQASAQTFPSRNQAPAVPSGAGWGQLWMPFAAILLLCMTLDIASYRIGMKKGVETAVTRPQDTTIQATLEGQLSDAGKERERLRAEIAGRDQTIAELRKQIQEQPAGGPQQKAGASAEQDTQRTATDAAKLEALQKQLDAEQQARSQLATRASDLEAKVADLSKQLQDSGLTITQQKRQLDEKESALDQSQELLEHDRDIRELMGARKLYVVDVYDVGGNVDSFLSPLPVGRLPGVGKVTDGKLKSFAVEIVADLKKMELTTLERQFGRYGVRLYELARGIDNSEVVPDRPTRSISTEDTFEEDVLLTEIEPMIRKLAEKTWSAARKESRVAHTVVLKLKTSDFRILTRSHTPISPPSSCEDLANIALALRVRVGLGPQQRFRLVGVGLSNFREREATASQSALFE
jgi:hypothetical protein